MVHMARAATSARWGRGDLGTSGGDSTHSSHSPIPAATRLRASSSPSAPWRTSASIAAGVRQATTTARSAATKARLRSSSGCRRRPSASRSRAHGGRDPAALGCGRPARGSARAPRGPRGRARRRRGGRTAGSLRPRSAGPTSERAGRRPAPRGGGRRRPGLAGTWSERIRGRAGAAPAASIRVGRRWKKPQRSTTASVPVGSRTSEPGWLLYLR